MMAGQALLKNLFCVNLIIRIIWTDFGKYTPKSGKLFKVFVSLLVAIILSLAPPGQFEPQKRQIWEWSGVMMVSGVWLNLEIKWLALNLVQQPTLLSNICNNCYSITQYLHSARFDAF